MNIDKYICSNESVQVVTSLRHAEIMATFTKKWSRPLSTNEIVDIVHNLDSDDEATGIDIYIDPPDMD
ncbi:unnamed protein product [Parnassius mnemosyne]|uniref:Uncharacterized protein n=1 Tax=Parnassius mnemosyne TaxID=213953 RepID=A0AAV1LDK2_9NEOP